MTSFMAHTVPVYWGNPYVAEEYNPEAFVNCHDYDSIDGVVQRVKEIDEDDNLWAYMVSQPWQTEQQQRASEKEYERYKKFIVNIFSQPLDKAVRHTEGWFYERIHSKWFFEGKSALYSKRFLRRVIRILLNTKRLRKKIKDIFTLATYKKMKEISIDDYLSMRDRQDK